MADWWDTRKLISFSRSHLTLHFSASFMVGLSHESSLIFCIAKEERVKRVHIIQKEDLSVSLALPLVNLVKLLHFLKYLSHLSWRWGRLPSYPSCLVPEHFLFSSLQFLRSDVHFISLYQMLLHSVLAFWSPWDTVLFPEDTWITLNLSNTTVIFTFGNFIIHFDHPSNILKFNFLKYFLPMILSFTLS